jgi:hypothetical protein
MNYTIDLINSWAYKLAYRAMQISGATEEELQNYLKAVVDKQNGVIKADDTLATPIKILGITFKSLQSAINTGIIIIAIVGGIILYKRYSKR